MTLCTRQRYADTVVRNYLRLPGTPLKASRRDRQLAASLYDRNIPQRAVWAAFVIAAARWAIRSPTQPSLPAIRTLYYFLSPIDEALTSPPESDYVDYLAAKLQPLIAEKDRLLAAAATSPDCGRQTRQIPALPDRR